MANAHGQNLMQDAFDHQKGPLTDQSETDVMRKALPKLFAGAMGRFRNPSTHTQRNFPDLFETIEELMVASRLCASWMSPHGSRSRSCLAPKSQRANPCSVRGRPATSGP